MDTLLVKLKNYLQENKGRKIHGGDLERLVILNYWGEAETAKRRLREATEIYHRNYCPNIIKHKVAKNCVAYEWVEQPQQLSLL
jgi:hypothetical protein